MGGGAEPVAGAARRSGYGRGCNLLRVMAAGSFTSRAGGSKPAGWKNDSDFPVAPCTPGSVTSPSGSLAGCGGISEWVFWNCVDDEAAA